MGFSKSSACAPVISISKTKECISAMARERLITRVLTNTATTITAGATAEATVPAMAPRLLPTDAAVDAAVDAAEDAAVDADEAVDAEEEAEEVADEVSLPPLVFLVPEELSFFGASKDSSARKFSFETEDVLSLTKSGLSLEKDIFPSLLQSFFDAPSAFMIL